MACKWCGNTITKKHPDAKKAQEGQTLCPQCNMTHSPNATVKGSYAYWDGKKIVTGIIN